MGKTTNDKISFHIEDVEGDESSDSKGLLDGNNSKYQSLSSNTMHTANLVQNKL